MQPRGGFIEDVEDPALSLQADATRRWTPDFTCCRLQVRRQLHTLRFASRERGSRLPKAQVPEANLLQDPELFRDFRDFSKELERLLHGQIQDFMDVLASIANIQHLGLVACPLALLAHQFHVRKKLHFDRNRAVPLAGFAAAPREC